MVLRHTFATARVSAFVLILFFGSCTQQNQVKQNTEMPMKMVWAWERPEDLRFLDPNEFGVAFLAQTLLLEKDRVDQKARRQPLELAPGTYLIAVTRIESIKDQALRPAYSDEQIALIVDRVRRSLELPNVKGIQIDFDAAVSERDFYRKLMTELKRQLPANTPLTMTALASWCTGDAWFNDFPVDEAVPMVFQMGADSEKIRNYLRNGNDWREPLCRGSYGISLDEARPKGLISRRRIFYFKKSAWNEDSLPVSLSSSSDNVIEAVSVCDLAASPAEFHNKTVRFTGSIVNGLEGSWLGNEPCPGEENSIIVSKLSDAAASRIEQLGPTPGAGRVEGTITGTFKNSPFENCCLKSRFKFELLELDNAVKTN